MLQQEQHQISRYSNKWNRVQTIDMKFHFGTDASDFINSVTIKQVK